MFTDSTQIFAIENLAINFSYFEQTKNKFINSPNQYNCESLIEWGQLLLASQAQTGVNMWNSERIQEWIDLAEKELKLIVWRER